MSSAKPPRMFARMMQAWTSGSDALAFAVIVIGFYLAVAVLGSLGPQIQFSIPRLGIAIGSKYVFLMAASLLPAIACVLLYSEPRQAIARVGSAWYYYAIVVVLGMLIPFSAYLGSHYPSGPLEGGRGLLLVKLFLLNLFLTPLWEEIVWRGTFLQRLMAVYPRPKAVILSSCAWTIWHLGFMVYLYSAGVPILIICVLPILFFCVGIILCSIYVVGGSIWPCVVFHAIFNASTVVYYSKLDRVSEFSSYIAEIIIAIMVAAVCIIYTVKFAKGADEAYKLLSGV
jgi:membrane protease YdiL (CAAX protease family)